MATAKTPDGPQLRDNPRVQTPSEPTSGPAAPVATTTAGASTTAGDGATKSDWLTPRRFRLASLGIAVFTLAAAWVLWPGADLEAAGDFDWFFAHLEAPAALLALALLLVAPAGARRTGDAVERLAGALSRRPLAVAGTTALVLALGAATVYERFPLTSDEHANVFQARVFAAGHLAGRWPIDLVPWLLPPRIGLVFFSSGAHGEIVSRYWPGLALLLAPFATVRAEWLSNPLLAGVSILLLMALARRLYPGDDVAPGWVALLALASPAFTINGISYYVTNAHLCATLLFVWLLAAGGRAGAFLAGVVGSFALVLHQFVPHVLVATPWLLWTVWRRERRHLLLPLAAGYAPLAGVLGVGWLLWRKGLGGAGPLFNPARLPYAIPTPHLAWVRLLELLELVDWAVPGMVLLAIFGWTLLRRGGPSPTRTVATLLGASLATVVAGYLPFLYDQGHGWGARFLHVAWGALPLLAAAPLVRPYASRARWTPLVGFLVLGSLAAGTALRAVEVHRVITMRRAELPPLPAARPLACFVALERHFYVDDLIRNDPFLRTDLLLLGSRGKDADADLVARRSPGARAMRTRPGISCWLLPDGAIPALRSGG